MPQCTRPDCDNYAGRELCAIHRHRRHRLRVARGDFDQVDAATATAHLRVMRARGWTWPMLRVVAGMAHPRVSGLVAGQITTLRRHEERSILAQPATWQENRTSVPSLGSVRRMDALSWMGWPRRSYAAELGVKVGTLSCIRVEGRTSARLAARIAAFYDAHSHLPGPCEYTRVQARARGPVSGAAWTEESIDDPSAQPMGLRQVDTPRRRRGANIDLDEVLHLIEGGVSIDEVAQRLRVDAKSVRKYLSRQEMSA